MNYQVLARKYRPQTFAEILGQDAVLTTLKNGIRYNRLAHAYLFCGPRGTGKTTLARVLAKAINCQNLQKEIEPCNRCPSCKEITGGHSLDVLEIDGASHRGIEDIRRINENVGFVSTHGKYKVYLIDEVHMLTKEAFNALLKTLEEPPESVKFFFATTEAHKVLPTIVSRCQRFNLNSIPQKIIAQKLQEITSDLSITIEEEALHLLSELADGGMRDAESLLDQLISFHEGAITARDVATVHGVTTKEVYYRLDQAGKSGDYGQAFVISHELFSSGKDLYHFIEGLARHLRNLLIAKTCGPESLILSPGDVKKATESASLYSKEQCMTLLDEVMQAQQSVRFSPCPQIAVESILLKIMRSHHRIPLEALVHRLAELEESLNKQQTVEELPHKASETVDVKNEQQTPAIINHEAQNDSIKAEKTGLEAKSVEARRVQVPSIINSEENEEKKATLYAQVEEDPTPAPTEFPKKFAVKLPSVEKKSQSAYDTLFHFAAIELEGKLRKK